MPFSDVLNDVNAPKSYEGGESAIGGLAKVAAAVVGEFKDIRKNTIVEQATEEIAKEEQKLKKSLDQGNIKLPEYLQRLSTKQREITSNFPSVASDIRAGIKESLGILPTATGVANTVKQAERQQQFKDGALQSFITAGFGVTKADGSYDEEKTLSAGNKYLAAKNTLDLAKTQAELIKSTQGSPMTEGEKNDKLGSEYINYFDTWKTQAYAPTLKGVGDLMAATKGGDDAKFQAGQEALTQSAFNYRNQVANELAKSPLPAGKQSEILKLIDDSLKSDMDYIFEGNYALAKGRINRVNKLMENAGADVAVQAPKFWATVKQAGPSADLLFSSTITNNVGKQTLVDKIAANALNVDDTTSTVIDGKPTSSIPDARKGSLGNSLSGALNEYKNEQNLSGADFKTMAGTASALSTLVTESGSPKDIDTAIRQLDSSVVYSRLLEITKPGHEYEEFGNKALENMEQLATTKLKASAGLVRNEAAEAMYNPQRGRFEAIVNQGAAEGIRKRLAIPTGVQGAPSTSSTMDIQRYVTSLQPQVEALNHALNLAATTSMLRGDVNDNLIRQHLVESYGLKFNPKYQKKEVPENVKTKLNPSGSTSNVNGGVPEFDFIDGKLIPRGQ